MLSLGVLKLLFAWRLCMRIFCFQMFMIIVSALYDTILFAFVWQGSHFPGLVPLIYTYLDIIKCDEDTRAIVDQYIHLIVQRSRGTELCVYRKLCPLLVGPSLYARET